ncbi:MAG TPA: serine/threonine-protein kinase [Pseudonocardiaceae bacterium]|nr:serine/threonine-protein kinase [Pseudonocardiaceae bacterium]
MGAVTNPEPRLVAGRYRLDAVLGRGTMGTVWSAHDEVLGRAVAIKEVLLPLGIPDAEADALRERAMREARAIAALSHPNVVTLYDVAREGSAPFVVMELVASRSLAELTRDGPLPPQQVVIIGAAVAAALQAAHAAGITHRDVKPGNVLVAHDGRIKLTDFGIARNPADRTLTATGLMLGSPAYIAPEIASGGPVNPASDLWGLGATLFAAVEGRPPYDAGTAMATVAAVVQDEVPTASCSGALAEVIGGLMVKDPARRMTLSRVRQLLGPPPEAAPSIEPQPVNPQSPRTRPPARPVPVAGVTEATGALEMPGRRSGQLAADPGPLPFTPATPVTTHRSKRTGTDGRALLWTLAVLLFLGASVTGFGAARILTGQPALPRLGVPAAPGPSPGELVLAPRVVKVSEPDGTRPAQFTVSVPQGWPEFREQRTLGNNAGTVMRFVSPDGSEVIAVERVTGALPGSPGQALDQYLTSYLRKLAQGLPQLVETQRRRMSGGVLDATIRTQEGGELRRTTYLRMMPVGPDLWVVSVTVPTEREAAGRTKLFEPVVAAFAANP